MHIGPCERSRQEIKHTGHLPAPHRGPPSDIGHKDGSICEVESVGTRGKMLSHKTALWEQSMLELVQYAVGRVGGWSCMPQ